MGRAHFLQRVPRPERRSLQSRHQGLRAAGSAVALGPGHVTPRAPHGKPVFSMNRTVHRDNLGTDRRSSGGKPPNPSPHTSVTANSPSRTPLCSSRPHLRTPARRDSNRRLPVPHPIVLPLLSERDTEFIAIRRKAVGGGTPVPIRTQKAGCRALRGLSGRELGDGRFSQRLLQMFRSHLPPTGTRRMQSGTL